MKFLFKKFIYSLLLQMCKNPNIFHSTTMGPTVTSASHRSTLKKKKKHTNAVILQSGVRNEVLCTFLLTCFTCGVVTQGSDLSHSTCGLTTGTELVLSIYSHPHTVGRVSVMKVLLNESMKDLQKRSHTPHKMSMPCSEW